MRNLLQMAHGRAMKRALGDVVDIQPNSGGSSQIARYDFGDPEMLNEFKRILRYLRADNMPVSDVDAPGYTSITEKAYLDFLSSISNPGTVPGRESSFPGYPGDTGWMYSGGDPSRKSPNINGLARVLDTAFYAAGGNYAGTYWPKSYNWMTIALTDPYATKELRAPTYTKDPPTPTTPAPTTPAPTTPAPTTPKPSVPTKTAGSVAFAGAVGLTAGTVAFLIYRAVTR